MSKNEISHRELIEGLLYQNELDQIPIAFWRHFPVDDQQPNRLADATTQFQNTFDIDLIKISPSSSFCIRDWGIQDKWSGNTEGTRDYLNFLSTNEARSIRVLDPSSGSLGNQLKAIEIIAERHLSTTPIIQTIFSPLSQLKNLLGKENLIHAIRNEPEIVKKILETITTSTCRFMEACLKISIDGFFFAVQHAASGAMSRNEFIDFGKRFDTRLFDVVNSASLNILHIHGSNVYFDLMLDYPCNILNWHDRDTSPNLHNAQQQTNKKLCGGLSRINSMVKGDTLTIQNEIEDAFNQIGSRKFLLGTGCVLPVITPYGNIKYAIEHARNL